jgi:hypothetical protein
MVGKHIIHKPVVVVVVLIRNVINRHELIVIGRLE